VVKKILLIPSWYPTSKKPLRGSYFREQAEFLNQSNVGQLVVLFGDEASTSFLKFIWIYFLSLVKKRWNISPELVLQHPEAYGFIIPKNRRVPDKYRVKLAIRLYKKAFLTLQSMGFKPELIHAQSGMDAGIYAHIISKRHSIPFVIIEHQVFVFHHYSRRKAKMVLDAFKAASKVAAVSHDQRRQILMNQPDCNPEVIPNLVDESKFEIVKKEESGKFKIITVMYANTIKGFETFFEAMSILKKESLDFEFTVIGNGHANGRDLFGELMERYQLEGVGKIIPKVNREEIPSLLASADLYVCSSIYETFGIAPREAMFCGLPVVTAANGGVEDCISHNTGLVVSIQNPKMLSGAILKILNKELNFDSNTIHDLAINQFGNKSFLDKMSNFYS
jgi:glycosyltransferase involved in cell wall biosynthesis